jgi:hypothetical protein
MQCLFDEAAFNVYSRRGLTGIEAGVPGRTQPGRERERLRWKRINPGQMAGLSIGLACEGMHRWRRDR